MDDATPLNRDRWNALARAGVQFSRPWLDLDAPTARAQGVPGEVAGADTLCLAAGAVAIAVAGGPAVAASYDELRAAAVARCEAIDPAAYQSGLLFNPDGYRSFFVRSECLQIAAKEFRGASLCEHVRQRRPRVASSWGYSRAQCLKEVAAGAAADQFCAASRRPET